jgi:hypothetical protein
MLKHDKYDMITAQKTTIWGEFPEIGIFGGVRLLVIDIFRGFCYI